jgi:hypothetical protein
MGFFSFLFFGALDCPASGSPSSPLDSGFPVIYSIFTSSCCANPTMGCDHGPLDIVHSLFMPFIWGATSAMGCYHDFYDIECFCSPTLLYGSMSVLIVSGGFPSSSTSVALNGFSHGEVITSTSMATSSYVRTYSSLAGSCDDLVLLHVFISAWIGG